MSAYASQHIRSIVQRYGIVVFFFLNHLQILPVRLGLCVQVMKIEKNVPNEHNLTLLEGNKNANKPNRTVCYVLFLFFLSFCVSQVPAVAVLFLFIFFLVCLFQKRIVLFYKSVISLNSTMKYMLHSFCIVAAIPRRTVIVHCAATIIGWNRRWPSTNNGYYSFCFTQLVARNGQNGDDPVCHCRVGFFVSFSHFFLLLVLCTVFVSLFFSVCSDQVIR